MLTLFNSLTRKIEEFTPIDPKLTRVYSCGPTVYQFAHIGNFRAYATSDFLIRTLHYNGLATKFVMNITDVGHLVSDADEGEDKLEKSAKKEGKTAWEVAEFYTDVFLKDYETLHFTQPNVLAKATDHIKEQIDLIKTLEEKGHTYQTSDGIYFDTSTWPEYGELSTLDQIKEGARVEVNEEKKNPRDFALWKFSPEGQKRDMEWKSPWGVGFPGWHIECSAMSMKYLGNHFDIHTGGVDHLSIHHPDEIAQSEAATGEKFVNYWLHTNFMLVNGEKMSKSKGNIYRVYDLEKENYDPMALRYLYLQTHYRQEMNFTFGALDSAQNALHNLHEKIRALGIPDDESRAEEFEDRFREGINDDLNMPKALAVVWELLGSDESNTAKINSILEMDKVLGLNLESVRNTSLTIRLSDLPQEVREMVEDREKLRKARRFSQADQIRNKIIKLGYDVQDSRNGSEVKKISPSESIKE